MASHLAWLMRRPETSTYQSVAAPGETHAPWRATDYLLAQVVDGLHGLIYVQGGYEKKPDPIERPGVRRPEPETMSLGDLKSFFGEVGEVTAT